ncbi:MAG: MazG family protein [Propionibacteriaceae bacterium]|nr:MazG family protein [Propionibacteriaceae bacterium]
MARLRRDCPWDAEQTPRSLAKHLIEETAETVDAIESGSDADLVEELGDVLLQVVFHAEIARGEGRFDIDDVADGLVAKLIVRHPWVFGDDAAPTHDNMMATWEGAKQVAKKRDSALDGIADALPTLARAAKVATRLRDNNIDAAMDLVDDQPDDFGGRLLALVIEAVQSGADPDQALRDATRAWEQRVRAAGL